MKDTLMHHRQPHPTVRMPSFNHGVQKGRWEWNHTTIHKSLLKHVATSQRSLEVSFFKKKKKNGGYFNDMPETFCQREK
jgi:hypothetical protein